MALSPWVTPIAYCERDRYAQALLLSRMRNGELPRAPIWDDVTTLVSSMLPGNGSVDIIYGGFPCQDISTAGSGAGLAGERSGLYLEIERLIRETKPSFVFLENVPAIRTRGLGRVVWGLSELGYDCRWTTLSAAEVSAVHIRKRWFLLANANGIRLRKKQRQEFSARKRPLEFNSSSPPRGITWASERLITPSVDRAGDGIPFRVDRHRCLGNSVVPLQARTAFEKLSGLTINKK